MTDMGLSEAKEPPQRKRRTRIVCISDTHNCNVALPKGDVLIHAGDLTNQGSYSELSKAVAWLEKADFECKIIIAGNHEITLDKDFYSKHGHAFHNQNPQDLDKCLSLLTSSPSLIYLNHESTTIRLTSPTGPRTTFKVFGSPYSQDFPGTTSKVGWAFAYPGPWSRATTTDPTWQPRDEEQIDLTKLWDDIPPDTDITVTHTPPMYYRDRDSKGRVTGCEALRRALWKTRPRLAVCGHVHQARGAEHVSWDPEVEFGEVGLEEWVDPAPTGKKICLVDLTDRRKGGPRGAPVASPAGADGVRGDGHGGGCEERVGEERRLQTTVVNCAIMVDGYRQRGTGTKTLNKPIVVDLDLPVWE